MMSYIPGGLVVVSLALGMTGGLTYLGYEYLLRCGNQSKIGFAAGTTAGSAVAAPAVVAAADSNFEQYVGTAIAQTAAAVMVTAVLAPLAAAIVLKVHGGLRNNLALKSSLTTATASD